ncbi:MAG TPA: hypothetical protein VN285_06720 [Candidatus Deferrimicrobium sp.]|nr:hypothetical protein [Candidatus Deferrimicrobium sp.]
MIEIASDRAAAFRRKVWAFYRRHGRSLWFRATTDPYRITVSEVMAQQTQIERVAEKYPAWIERWPDWKSLAQASTREVLAQWSGMGYNRRALYLKRMAQIVISEFDGRLPDDPLALRQLPGIGPYTANAIAIFAFDKRLAAVDTNVRKAIVHEFNLSQQTPAPEIQRIATRLLPRRNVKDWHHALMDYANVALPKKIATTRQHSKQVPYEGSRRQLRGAIVRVLTGTRQVSMKSMAKTMGRSVADVRAAAKALEQDHMVVVRGDRVRLVLH